MANFIVQFEPRAWKQLAEVPANAFKTLRDALESISELAAKQQDRADHLLYAWSAPLRLTVANFEARYRINHDRGTVTLVDLTPKS